AWAASLTGPFAIRMGLACFGQALHGFCFGCFLAVAFMYVDRESPQNVRGSAQTLYGTLILGIGFFLGGLIGGWVGELTGTHVTGGSTVPSLPAIWLSSAAMAAFGCVFFALFFPSDRTADSRAS